MLSIPGVDLEVILFKYPSILYEVVRYRKNEHVHCGNTSISLLGNEYCMLQKWLLKILQTSSKSFIGQLLTTSLFTCVLCFETFALFIIFHIIPLCLRNVLLLLTDKSNFIYLFSCDVLRGLYCF